jgi:hypothetical protein
MQSVPKLSWRHRRLSWSQGVMFRKGEGLGLPVDRARPRIQPESGSWADDAMPQESAPCRRRSSPDRPVDWRFL